MLLLDLKQDCTQGVLSPEASGTLAVRLAVNASRHSQARGRGNEVFYEAAGSVGNATSRNGREPRTSDQLASASWPHHAQAVPR